MIGSQAACGSDTAVSLEAMSLRIFTEPQQGASYDQLLTVARTAEECGFGAFFRSDHVLKMGPASGLPAATDAWVTLAGLARDTSAIRLGTLVTPVTFRPVGTFTVVAAQIDHMSAGRIEIGLGAGWYENEHQAFGLRFPPMGERYDLLEDQLAILHGTWSTAPGETFDLEGRTCSVSITADTVRPYQQPHPPIVLGGRGGPRSARLAATYADEYNTAFVPAETMRTTHDGVRRACEAAGRDPSTLVYSAGQVLCCGTTEAEIARRAAAIGREVGELRENGLAGTPAEVLDKLGRLAEHGAERFYLQVLDLGDLDHLRLVADEVLPHAPGR
jgi:F420-dependent oxidoreductase-like protein